MDAKCRIELLGGLRALQAGRLITRFSTQKTGALLAYLAYHRQQTSREVLIELFWPDTSPQLGRGSLSMALSSLRHQLEPPGVPSGAVIVADRFTVGLHPAMVTTDVAEFEAALQAADRAKTESERIRLLTEAVERYRGHLLPGYYEDWTLLEQARLEERFLQALRRLMTSCEQMGDLEAAIRFARRAISDDPLLEEAHRSLMRLYVLYGQHEQALRQYRELERLLDMELGQVPSRETRALAHQIEHERLTTPRPTIPDLAPEQPSSSEKSASAAAVALPSGTVTFLLTDIEGSTALWEHAGEAFQEALVLHHRVLRSVFKRHGGHEVNEMGDGFLIAFARSTSAVACAVAGQRELLAQVWPERVGHVPVRMGLFTGEVEVKNREYHGLVLHRASRVLAAAGHGGQILCAEATATLTRRDLEPGVRLTDLGTYRLRDVEMPERLYQIDYPGMPRHDFPPPKAEPEHSGSLPITLTRFFGRTQEIARLREMLAEPATRLITLTGPGGTGKTRLALETGARIQEAFAGGVWFVPLTHARDASQIVHTLGDVLRLKREPDIEPLEQVITALSRQPALLVLDNVEQVVEPGSVVVQTLLTRVPTLKLMVTSRQRLDVTGEQEFPVPPLLTPNGADTPERLSLFDSVQLFVDRAQVVRPDFQLTTHNAAAVAELCDRLEGIPLAIELAAARAQVLIPLQMLAQMENRFAFLVSRKRGADERHQTLRAAIEWSYQLLSPELQGFFAQLSVFRGGWTVEAAETVCEEPLALDSLSQLQECSLVLAEESENDEMRFRMLETLREYALGLLTHTDREELSHRHLTYFAGLAQAAAPQMNGAEQTRWLAILDAEHENLRVALDQAESRDTRTGLRLALNCVRFWAIRGHLQEGRQRLEHLLALNGDTQEQDVVLAQVGLGALMWEQSDHREAYRILTEALRGARTLEERSVTGHALHYLGVVCNIGLAYYEEAQAHYREAIEVWESVGNMSGVAMAKDGLGQIAFKAGDFPTANSLFLDSLSHFRQTGNTWWIATCLDSLSRVEHEMGNLAAALAYAEESVQLHRILGSKRSLAHALSVLAQPLRYLNEFARAYAACEESMALCKEVGDRGGYAQGQIMLAAVAYHQGDDERAVRYNTEGLLTSRLLENRTGIAFAQLGLALVTFRQERWTEAREAVRECLSLFRELSIKLESTQALNVLAGLERVDGRLESAARFLGAAVALYGRLGLNLPPYRKMMEVERAALQAVLPEQAFQAAFDGGGALSWEEAMEEAMTL